MIQPYSEDYFPPIPVLDVELATPEGNNWIGPYVAIVDSGADFSIVPMTYLRRIRPPLIRPATIFSHWRDARPVSIYSVDLRIGNILQPAVMVAGDSHSKEILLGRNLLNRLDLRLDGLKQRLHILRA